MTSMRITHGIVCLPDSGITQLNRSYLVAALLSEILFRSVTAVSFNCLGRLSLPQSIAQRCCLDPYLIAAMETCVRRG